MAPLAWEWMKRLEFGEFVYKANQRKKKKKEQAYWDRIYANWEIDKCIIAVYLHLRQMDI
jgi:hypothetical protein